MEPGVALITGGGRGIGRAVTIALARQGWTVAATYRKSGEQAKELDAELERMGARKLIEPADVSDDAAAETLVRRVEQKFGRLDALVNCAGSCHRIPLLEESTDGWHRMFRDNLDPVFYLSRAAADGMIARKWGRIVNFSIAKADQLVAQPFITSHYIAKVGVLVLTRSLAKTLAPYGITVNSISPGFIATEGSRQEEFAHSIQNIPAGHLGTPQDAVSVVCYLLSEEAAYVNGANIHLSGAWGI